MKKILITAVAICGVCSFANAAAASSTLQGDTVRVAKVKLANESDSVSYAIGLTVGQSLRNFKVGSINEQIVAKAIKDMLSENPQNLQIGEGEAMGIVQSYFGKARKGSLDQNLKIGQEFLAKNKLQAGIIELPSGLQYKIVNPGDSKLKPTATDTVVVHYTGSFLDGKVFDSSKNHGKPITFPLNRVIPGWTEGVQLVGKGGTIMLFIPANLAYGEAGAGNSIPGNSTLIFEIELIDVKVSAMPAVLKPAGPAAKIVSGKAKKAPSKTGKK
jgi:FKBP-type peptidyl-prolyl cis-trans isomerase FklB